MHKKMNEIPVSQPITNPIKQAAADIIANIFKNKRFEEYVPLQTGSLLWKKNYFLHENSPAFNDLKSELLEKGYEVVHYPYQEFLCDPVCNYRPENTKIKVKPSETGKTIIVIDNDVL
jgi:hypothetical protein